MPRHKNKNLRWKRGTNHPSTKSYYPERRRYLNFGTTGQASQAFSEAQSQGNTYLYTSSNNPVSGMIRLEDRLYLPELLAAENSILFRIKSLILGAKKPLNPSPPLGLSDTQIQAFNLAFSAPVSIITGGPGTGKTTTSSAILLEALNLGLEPVAMAPTGKAAKRMEEALRGHLSPSTIHRGLAWMATDEDTDDNGGPRFGINNPLPSKFLLIDEGSTIDLPLMAYLLDAVADDARIVFVGDADQLPPVGPGQPFLDFIKSGVIPTTILDRIFRQVEGSSISLACAAINNGNPHDFFAAAKGGEITLIESPNTIKSICDLSHKASKDLQILSPKRDTSALLNTALAPIFNPPRGGGGAMVSPYSTLPLAFDLIGRAGDKVQQIKNNYFKGVFNGDQGILERVGFMDLALHRIRRGAKILTYSAWPTDDTDTESEFAGAVQLSDINLPYIPDESEKELILAYAITIHRSQGSEWEEVAIDVNPGAYSFFSRRLFYTALSRAKRHAYIAGTASAIAKAIMTNRDANRRTALAERLMEEFEDANLLS